MLPSLCVLNCVPHETELLPVYRDLGELVDGLLEDSYLLVHVECHIFELKLTPLY